MSKNGSDWKNIKIKNVGTGEMLPDKSKMSWLCSTSDDKAIFYNASDHEQKRKFDETTSNTNEKLLHPALAMINQKVQLNLLTNILEKRCLS